MIYLNDLPPAFLPSVQFLLRECGPDTEAATEEVEAIARVALRLEGWIRALVPDGLPTCGEARCDLPATDLMNNRDLCPFHASPVSDGNAR
jgi:hypothetical protein